MTYLLDTNVLSLSSPTRGRCAPNFQAWLDENEDLCFLSVVTLSEVSYGIEKLKYQGATTKASVLSGWYRELQERFAGRIIPITDGIAKRAGEFICIAKYNGVEIGSDDAYIGATAAVFEYRVITYNWKDFETLPIFVSTPETVLPKGAGD